MIFKERPLLERLYQTNRLHKLFREGDCVLLALSGGPDSSALAGLFAALRKTRGLKLAAVHLNHGLSKQAPLLEKTAALVARRLDISFYSMRVNVAALAKKRKLSLEEAGRQERYALFVQTARKMHAHSVATAHTRDDQVETVLFRIFRGTSWRGIAGIPYSRDEKGIRVIRPLLDCEKGDLTAYVRSQKIPFRIDRSNRSSLHRRNRIRHELLPFLEKRLNPRVREAIAHLQQSCLELSPILTNATEQAWATCRAKKNHGVLSLERGAFRRLSPGLQQELFLQAAENIGVGRKALGRAHAEKARLVAETTQTLEFPGFTVSSNSKRILWALKQVRIC